MRVLCLNLQQNMDACCSEAFVKFSPKVQFRHAHYIFIDIESTSHLLGGEQKVLKSCIETARKFAPHATGAIADTAYTAQMLVHYKPFEISQAGEDFKLIQNLPLSSLLEMEGLLHWPKIRQIEHVIHFFQSVGIYQLNEVLNFELTSFRERWQETGVTIWKRLHQRELQVISPFSIHDPMIGYGFFDDPVSNQDLLMNKVIQQIEFLFLRLEGLGRFAKKLDLKLFCEYSNRQIDVSIEPVSPSRQLKLFCDLLKNKMQTVDTQNPVREFEVEILDVPEKIEQLNFLEPQDTKKERWQRLISFSQQSGCKIGFLQNEDSHFPEDSYRFVTDWPKELELIDKVETKERAIQVKTVHGKDIVKSPRPSLILNHPEQIDSAAVSRLQFLSQIPIERIDASWWESLKGEQRQRDYYYAVNNDGQLLWVYQDRHSRQYFLHGYFD